MHKDVQLYVMATNVQELVGEGLNHAVENYAVEMN